MAVSGDSQFELALPQPQGANGPRAIRGRSASPAAAVPAEGDAPQMSAPPAADSVGVERLSRRAAAAEASAPAAVLAPGMSVPRESRGLRRLHNLARLMRLDRPIGIWLLLWPEMWALWIAAAGHPSRRLLAIFAAGAVLMRSAGCIINDLMDRNIDPHVKRTQARPLAARVVGPYEALTLFSALVLLAGLLALQLNAYTVRLAFVGAGLTITYPLLKRFFPFPQLYLGLSFGWAVPMAFAATLGTVPRVGWLLLVAAVLWAAVYDTMYAMSDRDDDIRIGVQSSAVLFADLDRFMIGVMQLMVLLALGLVGRTLHFGSAYRTGLVAGAIFFVWQQWLIRRREREACLVAFQNNQYFGLSIFVGILLEYVT
jgi:4-hydroxybenzoate polyprenyltransferase